MAWGKWDPIKQHHISTPEERRWTEKLEFASNAMYLFLQEPPPGKMSMQKEYETMKKAWEAFNVAWFG